jgi:hypothetical protein
MASVESVALYDMATDGGRGAPDELSDRGAMIAWL